MNTKLIFLMTVVFALCMFSCINEDEEHVRNGNYHKDDKEGLRMFLKKPSTIPDKINAEVLGLDLEDVRDWYNTETWVEKVTGLTWNNESPRRIIEIDWSLPYVWQYEGPLVAFDASKWIELKKLTIRAQSINALELSKNKKLQVLRCIQSQVNALDVKYNTALTHLEIWGLLSTLDVSSNTELEILICQGCPLSNLDVSKNTKLRELGCSGGQITTLDVSLLTELSVLGCRGCQLSELDLSRNKKLQRLQCDNNKLTTIIVNANLIQVHCWNNHLPLSCLLVFSDMLDEPNVKWLGPQFLKPRTVYIGEEVDFSDQSVLKGIATQFEVRTSGKLPEPKFEIPDGIGDHAPPSDYTLIDGKIRFNRTGTYWICMSNEAVISRFDFAAVVCAEIKVL